MNSSAKYLKTNVVPQPLFQRWYAWPHLISPATAAMNVVDRHIKILKSYIKAPAIHAAAVKNPKMTGGPFIDYGGKRVAEVKELLEATEKQQHDLVELQEAIRSLDRLLQEKGKGFSLEELYAEVPDLLKGYVELVYDLNNQPGIRFFESLLYHSRFYNPEFQSVALSLTEEDHRPFVLSTPVLPQPGQVDVHIPFNHPGIDALYRMQRIPGSVDDIAAQLGIPPADRDTFDQFFTDTPPAPYQPYTGPGFRTRYFGHACILLESKDVSILVDPVISYGYDAEISRFTYTDLPDHIDYILITHNHQDHILLETMLQLRHRVGQIIVPRGGNGSLQDPSLRLMLRHLGFRNVQELEAMESISVPGGDILGIPFMGEHSDLDIQTKLTYRVRLNGNSVLFAADTNNIAPELYAHIHRVTGDIDVLFLGMECDGAPLSWCYGPLLTQEMSREMDHSRRLAGSNFRKGITMVEQFNCKEVYVYAMGQEPWLKYIMAYHYTDESNPILESNHLLEVCRQRGIIAERLFGEKELCYTPELTST